MKIYTPTQKLALHVSLILSLGFFIVYGLRQFIPATIGCVILFVLFRGLFHSLTRRRRWGKSLAALAVMAVSLLIIILPLTLVGIMLARKVIVYASNTDTIVDSFNKLLHNPLLIQLQELTGIDFQNKELLRQVATRVGAFATDLFTPLLSGTASLLLGVSVLYLVLYYVLVNEEKLIASFHKYLPFDDETIDEIYSELSNNVKSSVLGQGLIALVQATLVSIGFLIFGIKDAFFWGVVSFFAAFIPVLGTPLVWVPAAIIELANGDTFAGVGLLIYGGVLIINIDNVLRFAIAKQIGDIHPLITIFGVIFGLEFFGILGLVMGPLLISYFFVLVKAYNREYVKDKASPAPEPTPELPAKE
jgi:predicted PurR-regulated permease PerM